MGSISTAAGVWFTRTCMAVLAVFALHAASVFATGVSLQGWFSFLSAKNSLCSTWNAAKAYSTHTRTIRTFAPLKRELQLVRTDELGYRLWKAPEWEFWTPQNTSEFGAVFTIAQWRVPGYGGIPIHKGDVVVDGGAFIGDYAKWALDRGASKVIVVEPSPAALECIRRNLRSEIQAQRVVLYDKGLWDQDGRLFLEFMDESNPAANRVSQDSEGKQGVWVGLTTLDQMVAELKLERVDVLKLDIEGAESKAVLGGREFFRRFRPRVAIATEHTDDQLKNNRDTIAAMAAAAPFYKQYECEYCIIDGGKLVPHALYFHPEQSRGK